MTTPLRETPLPPISAIAALSAFTTFLVETGNPNTFQQGFGMALALVASAPELLMGIWRAAEDENPMNAVPGMRAGVAAQSRHLCAQLGSIWPVMRPLDEGDGA